MRRFTVLPSAPLPAPRCGAAWVKALALAAGALLLLPGCKVVTVYDRHGDRLPGIPFVAKKAVRKQETIWQQSGTLVTLVAELEAFPTNKLDLGSVVIGPGGLDGLAALLGTPLTEADILKRLTGYLKEPAARGLRVASNREVAQTVFDDQRYFITAYRPLVGSAAFAPEFNTDGMLTKLSASAEDKTIPTFLDPFKDALSTLANGAATKAVAMAFPTTLPRFNVRMTKVEQKILAILTVTKQLDPKEKIGKPIEPPMVTGEPYPAGVEVVISKPDEKKTEDDKSAFKFSGSVLPPKADK
jgi:hypothetical protein